MLRSDGAKGNDSCLKIRTLPHRSEEHTSELQSRLHLVCRLLLEKKKNSISHPQAQLVFHPNAELGVHGIRPLPQTVRIDAGRTSQLLFLFLRVCLSSITPSDHHG